MIELGHMHTLTVEQVDERSVWLQAPGERIALPRREATTARPGERLTVFVYGDAAGQPVATLLRPRALAGEFALLTVTQVTPHGAFLDWGIGKELLVPFRKQPERMQVGCPYLVKVCLDRQGRPFGNGRIDSCLEAGTGVLAEGEEVLLTLWQFTDLGAKVIVNHSFAGLLYRDELRPGLKPGDRLTGYVKRLREDGKIDVTLRPVGAEGAEEAKGVIMAALRDSGFLPLHDQSPPEAIRQALGLSKKVFKKAVGGLYKAGVVELTDEGIRLKKA